LQNTARGSVATLRFELIGPLVYEIISDLTERILRRLGADASNQLFVGMVLLATKRTVFAGGMTFERG
jgi:hypothetical protein